MTNAPVYALQSAHALQSAPRSGYDYVGGQIAAVVARFGLDASRGKIMGTYEDICRDSLAFAHGARPPNHSRINHDGTPIQYAATLGSPHRTLQFLGEAGGPGAAGLERIRANRECMAAVARRLGADDGLSSVTPLLDVLAPETDLDLLSDHGGAYWIGGGFADTGEAHLRIYVNDRWGKEQGRWARLERFAAHFGLADRWREIATALARDMEPLGTAVTFGAGKPPTGRIYLSAYGRRMSYYEGLAGAYGGPSFVDRLAAFGRCLLDDDYAYPTGTAVCSFGLGEGPAPDFKFELCAHCLFGSDAEAAARLRSWVEISQVDAADYEDMLDILSEGHLSDTSADLHCYVGLGLRRGAPYATIYLKPRLAAT